MLPQLRIFSLCVPQNWYVSVGLSPQSQEVFIHLTAVGFVSHQRIGSRKTEAGQRMSRGEDRNPRVIEELLEFCGSLFAAPRPEIRLSTYIDGRKAGEFTQLVRNGLLEQLN